MMHSMCVPQRNRSGWGGVGFGRGTHTGTCLFFSISFRGVSFLVGERLA